jgi:hypothetical protein
MVIHYETDCVCYYLTKLEHGESFAFDTLNWLEGLESGKGFEGQRLNTSGCYHDDCIQ